MQISLRMAIAVVALFIGHSGLSNAAEPASSTQEIAPGVYSFELQHFYSMFVVTDDGVAAFETKNSKHANAMLEAIRLITDQPVKYAFHSHNHWDHSSGGAVMQKTGTQTVMHRLAADWLAANPGPDSSTPDLVWDGARHDVELGNITVQLHYLGLNHGLGMTVFVIPERRVAYIADLVTPNRVMFSIVPDFNIKEWERSLGEILDLDFDIAVCSHSALPADEVMNGCTKTHVTDERSYIQDLRKAIVAEMQKGTPPSQIPAVIKLPQYAHWQGYDAWLALNAQRVMLDIWMGPYPWVATD